MEHCLSSIIVYGTYLFKDVELTVSVNSERYVQMLRNFVWPIRVESRQNVPNAIFVEQDRYCSHFAN